MNKGLLTVLTIFICYFATFGQNPSGDLRIEMLKYYNLVVDHNIQTPAGASPKSFYIGVKICNDGNNDMEDVFAYIGDYNNVTPGIYPTETPFGMPYSGTFSFTHEGDDKDATRFIGNLAAGTCVTQYWLVSYPLVDGNNNPVFGANSNQNDDLQLSYDVWASAIDNGNLVEANDSKTVQLRAEISANANKIWPNNTNKVPDEFLDAFPDKELGWRETTNTTHAGASIVLEGIWFNLGNVNKGFDNDGDYQYDYNFLLQPVGTPSVYDPNCFRLVKVSGFIVVKPKNGDPYGFEFEDQMHFENLPKNTGVNGMVFYEFAVLNGPCTAALSPYQEAASGKNREKFNADFGTPGGTLFSPAPEAIITVTGPETAEPGDLVEINIEAENISTIPLGLPQYAAPLMVEQEIPTGLYYVAGSAESNNNIPNGAVVDVLYSTDDGTTWLRTEPSPSTSVTRIRWALNVPLLTGETTDFTYQLVIPQDYTETSIVAEAGVSSGGADAFISNSTTIVLGGGGNGNGATITDIVFLDNGTDGGVIGDGIQQPNEPGLSDVTVSLFIDNNNDGELDNNDVFVSSTTTDNGGGFTFENLSEGEYLVIVDIEDTDIPDGLTNTTPSAYPVSTSAIEGLSFGFAQVIEVTNNLISESNVYESDYVDYQVAIENLTYTEDTDNSSTELAWASSLDNETNFENYPENLLGAPDVELAWPDSWRKKAKVKNFDFGVQEGTIEKVEIIISVCLDYEVYNDYLTISFEKEDGSIAYAPDPVLSANSTPSLNDYVGPPNIGWVILDITDMQDWDWDIFDAEWAITMEGKKVGGDDGSRQFTDAIGVRVTSSCCAGTNGEPGNECATVTEMPVTYEYDANQFQFISSSVPADEVSNGQVIFNNLGPLYPNEIQTLDLRFRALQPDQNDSDVVTNAIISHANDCSGVEVSTSDEATTVTIENLGSVSGYVFGDADADGWVGVTGYESGQDNFIPNVEVSLYGCYKNGDLMYPANKDWKSCTHGHNGGSWQLVKRDTTDDDGRYYMSGIDNGYYYIEIDESTLTNAAEQTADPDYTSGVASSYYADAQWKNPWSRCRDMGIIGIGNDHTNVNFGYHVYSSFSGMVWEDIDGDGLKDANEPTIANAPVEIQSNGCNAGSNCPVIYTNGQGVYTYSSASAGVNYTLEVDLDNVQGSDSWNITFEYDGTTDNACAVAVAEGEQLFDVNFGLQASGPMDMGGTVYYDWSGNAHMNTSDEGIADVTMYLYKDINNNGSVENSDQLIETQLTGTDGTYAFENKPEANYVISLEENSLPIFPSQTEDPDEYGPCVTCDAKTAISSQDYIVTSADIWDKYATWWTSCLVCDDGWTGTNDDEWADNNLDLVDFQDPIGNPGACVTHLKINFKLAASDFEKSTQSYYVDNINYHYPIELNGVQIGTFNPIEMPYVCNFCEDIEIIFPVDLNSIPYNFGGTNTLDVNFYEYNQNFSYNYQQDICVADVKMEFLTTTCSDDYSSLDFGYRPAGGNAEIQGYAFFDDNANGVINNGEEKLTNIEVRLEADYDGDNNYIWVESTTTDNTGYFTFEELLNGTYRVIVNTEDEDLPEDYNGAVAQLTTLETQSIVVASGEIATVNGATCNGECNTDSEIPAFGFAMPATAVGYVYTDFNGDGSPDVTETGIGDVTLYICNAADGFCNATNALDTVTTSNGGISPIGFYQFTGLGAGSFTIAVDDATVPANYTLTADPSTDGVPCYAPLDALDANYDMLSSECDHMDVNITISLGTQYTGANFGYQPPGTVGGVVWLDANEDGVFDDEEDGLYETQMTISNVTAVIKDGITYNPSEYTDETYTDEDGIYLFSQMPDGTYDIQVTAPVDFDITFERDGGIDGTIQVVIDAGQVVTAQNPWCTEEAKCALIIDFGLTPDYTNTLAGVVCLDGDEDGRCDTGGETFPEGTRVAILDLDGFEYGETSVATDGTFFFDNLPSTDMVVTVSKTVAPLKLTSLTTSLGDTPAYDVEDREYNSLQFVSVSGDVVDMHYGFTFSDTFDLGDLPLPFLTRADGTTSGPAHIIPANPSLYLGAAIDAEASPVIQDDARGDNDNGVDDEDGVEFINPGEWAAGTSGGSLTATVFGNGYLIVFADFNFDGDFSDAGEMVISQAVTTGVDTYQFDIPNGTDLSGGQDIYFRVRLFKAAPFSPLTAYNGIVEEGEVEDYRVSICKNLTNPGVIAGAETGCDGYDPAEITVDNAVEGGGGSIEYIWEQSTDGGLTWNLIAGATDATYDPAPISQTTRYQRGARRMRCSDFVYSNAIVKTVVTNYTDPGIIVGNEENCGIYDPGIILNVVAPSGGDGTSSPFYQWEQSTNSGGTWTAILNANEEYYNPGVISQTTVYRRATRKMPCGVYSYSNEVIKMVSVNYTEAGLIDGAESVCGTFDPTEITSLSLPAGGIDGYEVMQWEQSVNGGASWLEINGATGATYDPGIITETTQYRRKSRRVPCTVWINSNVVIKTVKPFPTANIISFPISATGYLCELTDYEFDAQDAGPNVDYSWDFGAYGAPATTVGQGPHHIEFDVPDADALSSTLVTLTTEKEGCVSTDNKSVTFRPEIIITGVETVDPAQCQAKNGEITITASHPVGTTIEYSIDGGLSWQASEEFTNQGAGVYEVRVRYLGGDCSESYGAVALSDPPPQSTLLISSIEECTGQTITIEAIPINSDPVFTWTFGNGAIPNTVAGAGPHSVYFAEGGFANIAVTMEENNCIGVRDTSIAIVENYTDGGNVLGGETLCSTFDPTEIVAGSNPSGGIGGSLVYQWESREEDGLGGYTAWTDVAGANDASYDPGVISATTEFRRKARRAPCSDWVTTNSVIARLVQKPNLGDDTYHTVCPGFPHADNVNSNDLNLVNPTYSLSVFPTNGVVDFEADGEFIYDPSSTYCGTDEFQYIVCNDGTGCCDTADVVIDLTDVNPPSILNVPANILISCDDQIPVADAVDVIEDCQTVSIGTDEFTTQGTDSCAMNSYLITRIWNGVDYCSNTASAQQTITIQDATAPDLYRIYTLPNGKRMVAGVMENVSNYWKTVALPIQFNGQPVIFTQVTSRNDITPVTVKMRNVSTTQFQMKLVEEEGNDGVHAMENVSWIAFEKGAYDGENPYEVDSWLMDGNAVSQTFSGSYSTTPDFFATIQTNNEADPATVRINGLTNTGLDVWLGEETSSDAEVAHNLETVGYMAFAGNGDITNEHGEVIGEMGRVDLSTSMITIETQNKYHNPVVIIGAVTSNEGDAVTTRVTAVNENAFSVQLQEWDYLDGVHNTENLCYMVMEGSLPLDKVVACDAIPEPLKEGIEVIAMDNCDATIKLIMTEDSYTFDCQTDTTFTRSWYSIDDCGNKTELTETYILRDTVPPTFTVPDNLTIVCGDDKDDLTITGDVEDEMDNCSVTVGMSYTDDLTNLVGCNGHIIRTWKAIDDCGNQTFQKQNIYVSPQRDTDRDGIVDYFDHDDDNDGIPDIVETSEDSDGDGIPNDKDTDSDNDGVPDLIESGGIDTNGDGIIDIVGEDNWDNDGDGFAYGFDGSDIDSSEIVSVVFDPSTPEHDQDGDGVPNFLDRDSDNDGIPDLIEVGGVDTNGDGIIDYPILSDPTTMADNDEDGFYDLYDPNINLIPGIEYPNNPLLVFTGEDYEGTIQHIRPDFDRDRVPDFLDSDSDNDGTGDLIEVGGIDINGDGKLEMNGNFDDLNGDGFSDIYVAYPLITTDEDGTIIDGLPEDTDNNGTVYDGGDVDYDGSPNHLDLDSDNDNILDMLETGLNEYDGDNDGVWDNIADDNNNGYDDIAEATGNIMTEGDGDVTDGRAEDSGDADESAYSSSQPDGTFAQTNGTPDIDDDGDDILNFLDTDSDNDLLPDSVEDANHNNVQDEGETDLYNPDSDYDQIKDGVEDRDRNGSFGPGETDPLNPNTDGDDLLDGEEDINFDGILDPIETDPTNACDPIINAACRDVVLNVKVNLMGAMVDQDSLMSMRDDLRYQGKIPAFEPYSGLPHMVHIGVDQFIDIEDIYTGGGIANDSTIIDPTSGGNNGNGNGNAYGLYKESCDEGNFYVTGNDAPVDWVMIELRAAENQDSVIATRAAILQRDGDVRDIDGISYLTFDNVPSGNYYVSIRHRNHLGVVTANTYLLSPTVSTVDFTDPNVEVNGNYSRCQMGDKMALWAGDLNGDSYIIYQGPWNDVLSLFQSIVLEEDNTDVLANYIVTGYDMADFNMDGNIIYQGPNNDKAKLLINTTLGAPENTLGLSNFVLIEQLP